MAGDIIGRHAVMIPNIGTMHVRVDLLTAKCVEFADSDSNSSFVRTARMMITLVQWLAKLFTRAETWIFGVTYTSPRACVPTSPNFLGVDNGMFHVKGTARAKIKKFKMISAAWMPVCNISRSPQWPSTFSCHIFFGGSHVNTVAKNPAIESARHRPATIYESILIVRWPKLRT